MTEGPVEADVLDATLTSVLNNRPDARLAALADDGHLVPVPDTDQFRDFPVVPVPVVPAGMLGLVVPGDQALALTLWDRCRRRGIARGVVRLIAAPDRPIRFMLIDIRHHHGVRLCVMDPEPVADRPDDPTDENMIIGSPASRPRNTTLRRNIYGVITGADERMSGMLGWSMAEFVNQPPLVFLHPDDHERAIASWLDFTSSQQTCRDRVRYQRSTGDWLWVEVEHTFHPADDLDDVYITAHVSDVSDEMAAHEAVNQREKLFRRLTESLPMGLFLVHTDGTVGYANARLPAILGIPSAATLEQQLATVAPADQDTLAAAFTAVLTQGMDLELEVRVWLPDGGRRAVGEERRCRLTLTALSDQEGLPGAIVTVSDVTEAARMHEELQQRASFDNLTGCHNRASTMAALDQALADPARELAVVFVDLDGFKPINDELGHAAGDELLQYAAASLNCLPRTGDLVGRIGGDEFLLICHGVSTRAEALSVGERVSAALHRLVAIGDATVELRASIGVALSAPGLSADDLVALADAAMYHSKREGIGTPVLSPATPTGS